MVFKRMLRAFGVGGPTVDTVLTNPNVRPGEMLSGEVRIAGGDHPAEIDHVTLALLTRVEVESGDNEYNTNMEFHKFSVGQRIMAQPHQNLSLPFQVPVPFECPLNVVGGMQLSGMQLGLRTELEVRGAVDPGDLDPIWVHPLPSQDAVLQAFGQMGFRFTKADNERGRIHGVPQQLPFYQEIEFFPPQQYRGLHQVELSFVADEHAMDVVLEMDKKPGLFSEGSDTFRSFQVGLNDYQGTDWTAYLNQWLSEVGSKRNWF